MDVMKSLVIYIILLLVNIGVYAFSFFVSNGYISETSSLYVKIDSQNLYTHLTFILLMSVTFLLVFEKFLDLKKISQYEGISKKISDVVKLVKKIDVDSHLERERMDNYGGICRIHDKFPQEYFVGNLSTSKKVIILNTFIPHLEDFEDEIVKALDTGCDITLLLLNPCSDAASLRTDLLTEKNKIERSNVSAEIYRNIDTIHSIIYRIDEVSRERFKVKFFTYYPPCSIYKTDNFLFVGLFHVNKLAIKSPQLQVSNSDYIYSKSISDELSSFEDISLYIDVDVTKEILHHSFLEQLGRMNSAGKNK